MKVDPAELELALINVVLNAKLAMSGGGELEVHISNDKDAPAATVDEVVHPVDSPPKVPEKLEARLLLVEDNEEVGKMTEQLLLVREGNSGLPKACSA